MQEHYSITVLDGNNVNETIIKQLIEQSCEITKNNIHKR